MTDTVGIVHPYWYERQKSADSPDVVPGVVQNITHRDWTVIGTLSSAARAVVDPRGLVTPHGRGWSLDWWVRAEDGWHLPSRAPVVRQRLLGDAPVVETAMRVPGGDVLHRAYGIHTTELGACAAIEVENRSAVPVALALSIRPFDVLGEATVHTIDALDATTFTVNGSPALLLPKPAAQLATSASTPECLQDLTDGTPTAWRGLLEDGGARANAAFVFALTHTAQLRLVLPLELDENWGARTVAFPNAVPTAETVARGWDVQLRQGMTVTVPDDRVMHAVDAARAHLLLTAAGAQGDPRWSGFLLEADDVAIIESAVEWGFVDVARVVLDRWLSRLDVKGNYVAWMAPELAAEPGTWTRRSSGLLSAIGRWWSCTRDRALVDADLERLVAAADRLDDAFHPRRRLFAGDPPPSLTTQGWLGLAHAAHAAHGFRGLAPALAALGQRDAAADVRGLAQALEDDVAAALVAMPVPDEDDAENVLGVVRLLGSSAAMSRIAEPALQAVRTKLVIDGAVVAGSEASGALSPSRTAQLAQIDLDRGDHGAVEQRLRWLLDHRSPTSVWPESINAATRGGAGRRPQDPAANAHVLALVRRLLVRELPRVPDGRHTIALCSHVPPAWLGQSIDVRRAPTAAGLLSFSVRWHGDRPALLWEVEPHPDVTGIELRAPGLDATWWTHDLSGEALLEPVPVPTSVAGQAAGVAATQIIDLDGGSFS